MVDDDMADDEMPFPTKTPAPKKGKPMAEAALPDEAPKDPDPEDDEPAGSTKLGIPISTFTPEEISYIDDRESDILNQLGTANRSSAQPLVNEVILCDVEIRRLDAEMSKKRRRERDMSKLATELKPLKADRKEFMDRMLEAMKNLGIMPKDYIQTDTAASSLTDLWVKYRKELDSRRREGWKIGQLSPEAQKLCVEVGAVPENYSSQRALSDEARDEVLQKTDDEKPRP